MFTIASFFAGVGGIDLGFSTIGTTIYANEFDPFASKTFETNFPITVDQRDICHIKATEIPNHDILVAGFPCQAFSVAGYREGFQDKKGRGNLFFELARIIKRKKPRVVFLENVKNLVGHDNGKTFRIIVGTLESLGYYVKYKVLNAMHFGNIPQNRERIYMVAFRKKSDYHRFSFPKPVPLTTTIHDIIQQQETTPSLFYSNTCPFFEKLTESIIKEDTVYQWRRVYVRENKSNVCPTLTANMGTGGHNVPLIKTTHGIRKLSPRECFSFQGFPLSYKLPMLANCHLYKQAGNSVVVPVIYAIAIEIQKAITKK